MPLDGHTHSCVCTQKLTYPGREGLPEDSQCKGDKQESEGKGSVCIAVEVVVEEPQARLIRGALECDVYKLLAGAAVLIFGWIEPHVAVHVPLGPLGHLLLVQLEQLLKHLHAHITYSASHESTATGLDQLLDCLCLSCE